MVGNDDFPIIFETVQGDCQKTADDSSSFNLEEVKAVIKYAQQLLDGKWNGKKLSPMDIGVVSPYRRQCEFIRNELHNNGFDGIVVGTAEVFQGQERPIMIISTVRTDDDLGKFVKNERVRSSNKIIVCFILLILSLLSD